MHMLQVLDQLTKTSKLLDQTSLTRVRTRFPPTCVCEFSMTIVISFKKNHTNIETNENHTNNPIGNMPSECI
jgi:hypothetical protein